MIISLGSNGASDSVVWVVSWLSVDAETVTLQRVSKPKNNCLNVIMSFMLKCAAKVI
jgi:hypothetical protein